MTTPLFQHLTQHGMKKPETINGERIEKNDFILQPNFFQERHTYSNCLLTFGIFNTV